MGIISYLNENKDLLTIIFGGISTLISVLSLVAAILVIREAQKTRRQSSEPHIIGTVEYNKNTHSFDFVVENVGGGIGFDVSANIDNEKNVGISGRNVSLTDILSKKIPTLKSKQQIRRFFKNSVGELNYKTNFSAKCTDVHGKQHEFSNKIDLSIYEGVRIIEATELQTISGILDKISRSINSIERNGLGQSPFFLLSRDEIPISPRLINQKSKTMKPDDR